MKAAVLSSEDYPLLEQDSYCEDSENLEAAYSSHNAFCPLHV